MAGFLNAIMETGILYKKRIPCVDEELLACQGGLCFALLCFASWSRLLDITSSAQWFGAPARIKK